MGIEDRDYMGRDNQPWPPPRRRASTIEQWRRWLWIAAATASARLIVAHRPHNAVEDLLRLPGIGPQNLESMRPFIKVDGETERLR